MKVPKQTDWRTPAQKHDDAFRKRCGKRIGEVLAEGIELLRRPSIMRQMYEHGELGK